MKKESNYQILKEYCLKEGVDLFGVADISKIKHKFNFPKSILKKINRAICLGVRLSKGVLMEIEDKPTLLYSHHYKNLNTYLDQLAFRVSLFLGRKSELAIPVPSSQIIDWKKQISHASHKEIGYLAGLGWLGRNNLLVNEDFGSQIRLVTILTSFNLKSDKPTNKTCGSCFKCLKECPAQAIKKDPKKFDHIRCFEKVKEFSKMPGVHQYICGVCIRACSGRKNK
ncbi:MAG: hypothetical protein P9L96_03920 [Candidatus Gygaella obscura]|nr:hypothetical protein [Candidatus Gygaella obscura]